MRPLSPVKPAAQAAQGGSGGVDRNTTLTLNDGTVWRPLLANARMVLVGESKPVKPYEGPAPVVMDEVPGAFAAGRASPPPPPALRRAADPPRPVQRPLF